jgi:hypothetical protein
VSESPDGSVASAVERPTLARSAFVVTRVTVVQLLRKQRSSPLLLAIVVGFNCFVAAVLVGLTGDGAYHLGVALAESPESVGERVRRATLMGVVLVTVMQTLGAASDARARHRRSAFLTATSTAAVVAALLVRRAVAALVLFGPAIVATATAFAVGAGTPVSAVSLGVGALWLLVASAVLTLPFGLVANWVVAGYDLSSNARVGLGVVVLGVFYLALFGRELVAATLGATPVAWAGDLLLLTVPGTAVSVPHAAAFAVGSVALVGLAGLACVKLAVLTWYSDPVFGETDPADREASAGAREAARGDETTTARARDPTTTARARDPTVAGDVAAEGDTEATGAETGTDGAVGEVTTEDMTSESDGVRAAPVETFGTSLRWACSPRTAALVALTWRRTRRTPKVLFYVYPSALVGLVMAEQLVLHGPFSPAMYPAVVGFAGATAVGSGFTLNPLGTEGDALPALLTSGAGSGRLVRAKALAAVLPGGPLVLGGVLGVGMTLGRLPATVLLATLAYALALVTLAALCSQALGVHCPPDHEELLGGSVKVPNKSASLLYTVGMTAVALPGFAGIGQYALSGAFEPLVLFGGVAVSVAVAGALGWFSYRHAVARLDSYSVE